MPESLALAGLVIGVALYALLIRRRATGRTIGAHLASALASSTEIGLARIRDIPRRRAEAIAALERRPGPEVAVDRRTGEERRHESQRGRGRGRRSGGDRRVNTS